MALYAAIVANDIEAVRVELAKPGKQEENKKVERKNASRLVPLHLRNVHWLVEPERLVGKEELK
jgi:hypothetical protein